MPEGKMRATLVIWSFVLRFLSSDLFLCLHFCC
jgi:hypothetical protein